MASKEGKTKKGKDNEKKNAKKTEDVVNVEEKKTDEFGEGEEMFTDPVTENQTVASESRPVIKPKPIYHDPLSKLIVENYMGDMKQGLYDGEGIATFAGGHLYRGMFSEGLMHGKGEYTWADGLVYEGDFYKNKITGTGFYKWPDGSTYDGEVLDGKRHGYGTFYCHGDAKSYIGEWKFGKRHGRGRMDYDPRGQSFYDGEWVDNIRHGTGVRRYISGNIYQGHWFNNVRHGEGTMKWLDRDQIYMGTWENGIQHGQGRHIWLLKRKAGSQYSLRNMYQGDFVSGLRHGYGAFYYANGAKYEGQWKNNMKHGEGKFTFKNGRIFEGRFEKDHIVEFPDFVMDGVTTPDLSQIRTKTPLPTGFLYAHPLPDNLSVHSNESINTVSPSFHLEIDSILQKLPDCDQEEETIQVMNVITRHISSLRRIYVFYSSLGHNSIESPDNTYFMTRMQFWRFLKDCKLHHHEITLMEMDRVIGNCYGFAKFDYHQPFRRLLQRQFINYLIILAFKIHYEANTEKEVKPPILAWCLSKLMQENILPNACNVKGHFLFEARRAINAFVHIDSVFNIYQDMCTFRQKPPYEPSLKMRTFLFMMKDFKLINGDLTISAILSALAVDDPAVADETGCYNLEVELTFLEFFEALIGCAEFYVMKSMVNDPATPCQSTCLTQDNSMLSFPPTPAVTSMINLDVGDGEPATAHRVSCSSDVPLRPGSAVGTARSTGEAPGRSIDIQSSSTNMAAGLEQGQTSGLGSAKAGKKKKGKEGKENEVKENKEGRKKRGKKDSADTRGDIKDLKDGKEGSKNESVSEVLLEEQVKSSSLLNTPGAGTEDGPATLSGVAFAEHGQEDAEGDQDEGATAAEQDEEEEVLDEAARQFNFWTHQVHVFFVRKFLPAFQQYKLIGQRIEDRLLEEAKAKAMKSTMSCGEV